MVKLGVRQLQKQQQGLVRQGRLTRVVTGWIAKRVAQSRPDWLRRCARPDCRAFTCTASWLRRDGILLDACWLCSETCLAAQLLETLRQPAPERRVFRVPPRMPFRLALLRQGLVTEDALKQALDVAETTGQSLATVLVSTGVVTEEQLAAARAIETGSAHYTLPVVAIDDSYVLPARVAEWFQAATVHASPERWVIGFVDRVDQRLLAMVERLTGTRLPARLPARLPERVPELLKVRCNVRKS
jgi:hypothetical protein